MSTTDKEYQIKLKAFELNFIRDVLCGLDEMMSYAEMHYKENCTFVRENHDIQPYYLADKIYGQYHDDDGELL